MNHQFGLRCIMALSVNDYLIEQSPESTLHAATTYMTRHQRSTKVLVLPHNEPRKSW
jgi:hypothetical protein